MYQKLETISRMLKFKCQNTERIATTELISRKDEASETMQVLDSITIRAVHLSFPPTGSASEGGDGLKLPAAASDL